DSDIYKWMEAAAFVLQSGDRPALRTAIDRLTGEILAAQEPSGYLNTYWTGERASQRFTEQTRGHELYCLGHLIQAGIAYYRATGNRKLLDGGIRFADYLTANFGPQGRPALTGHPELELALVELYRTTGERRYLDFAGYLLSGVERERLHLSDRDVRYMFSGIPFTSRQYFEGHAVRAMYASSGAADYYLETGDAAYRQTLERLWRDLLNHKMYLTGGVGSRAAGETIGEDYELPNAQAYGESCAAIGNMMWNWRMLLATGESRFAEVMERALYNGINSGMSLDGTLYCYRNPLESAGEQIRNPWYDTTCCPPNLERTLAQLPGYLYSTSTRGIFVNFYHSSELDWRLETGTGLKVSQNTGYPWQNVVRLVVTPAKAEEFSLYLRIPDWSAATRVSVNDAPAPQQPKAGTYLEIRRLWKPGDRVTLELDLRSRVVAANPLVRENVGRIAVERGPLVYCLEQPDQPGVRLFDLAFTGVAAPFREEFRPDFLGGVLVLHHNGVVTERPLADDPLYGSLGTIGKAAWKPAALTMIPYYAWANRGPGAMEVWVPLREGGRP
ncbi:MAG TPA: beta-L-arabinofuranosidase domain-containing protein, partial [Bryobacteraceae bacterium]|nr:beta-L-arabinofuranosidase domain-containing protein [Bryobacteraceae bacterium]